MQIKALITDFDGTLADTFEANYQAYSRAFADCGRELSREDYRRCFGMRFDDFMTAVAVIDPMVAAKIRRLKGEYYPGCFDSLRVNAPLLTFLRAFKAGGGKVAVASTARRENLLAALSYLGAADLFDLVLAGADVSRGKPDPEIYLTALSRLGVKAEEALVFEDTDLGARAASAAGICHIKINPSFYGN